jgi:hypothetical protein
MTLAQAAGRPAPGVQPDGLGPNPTPPPIPTECGSVLLGGRIVYDRYRECTVQQHTLTVIRVPDGTVMGSRHGPGRSCHHPGCEGPSVDRRRLSQHVPGIGGDGVGSPDLPLLRLDTVVVTFASDQMRCDSTRIFGSPAFNNGCAFKNFAPTSLLGLGDR